MVFLIEQVTLQIYEKKCNRAVELSVEKYCGVMEMFRKFANVNTKIHFQTQ
jgi:putative redox protein